MAAARARRPARRRRAAADHAPRAASLTRSSRLAPRRRRTAPARPTTRVRAAPRRQQALDASRSANPDTQPLAERRAQSSLNPGRSRLIPAAPRVTLDSGCRQPPRRPPARSPGPAARGAGAGALFHLGGAPERRRRFVLAAASGPSNALGLGAAPLASAAASRRRVTPKGLAAALQVGQLGLQHGDRQRFQPELRVGAQLLEASWRSSAPSETPARRAPSPRGALRSTAAPPGQALRRGAGARRRRRRSAHRGPPCTF
jgi:hypothetical protein